MAYPTHIAAALTGTTTGQLAYWRKPIHGEPLFAPELGKKRGSWRYTYRDLVALRSFAYLRDLHSLQQIRRAVKDIRDLGNTEHLSECRILLSGDDIIIQDADDNFINVGGGRHNKHTRLIATLADVFAPFENVRGEKVVDFRRPRRHIEVDPETLGGYPVVLGTRIEFDIIGSLVEDGVPPDRIAVMYPAVSRDAAVDAQDFTRAVNALRGERVAG